MKTTNLIAPLTKIADHNRAVLWGQKIDQADNKRGSHAQRHIMDPNFKLKSEKSGKLNFVSFLAIARELEGR